MDNKLIDQLSKISLNEFLDSTNFNSELLIMAAHNPKNCKYVWYWDEVSKQIIGSFKSGSHDSQEFATVASKDKAIRGRVFDFNGKTILIIYGSIAGWRDPSNEEIRDIYLKIVNEYPDNIDYVVGETGKSLDSALECISGH